MKIYLTDQKYKFDTYLSELMTFKVMKYDRGTLHESVTVINLNSTKKLKDLNLDFLFDYSVFPSNILTHLTQWSFETRKMQIGDTILQEVFIPPVMQFSQKIIFGVRINAIIHEATRIGFSYETLDGHVEKGESTFTIEEIEGKIIFKIHTFSEPGSWLTKLLGPIFSRPYQAYCTRKALENVKKQVL